MVSGAGGGNGKGRVHKDGNGVEGVKMSLFEKMRRWLICKLGGYVEREEYVDGEKVQRIAVFSSVNRCEFIDNGMDLTRVNEKIAAKLLHRLWKENCADFIRTELPDKKDEISFGVILKVVKP